MDFALQDHGSIFVLQPVSEAGEQWAADHLPDDALTWGNGTVIEPRYVDPIIDGIVADGLTVE